MSNIPIRLIDWDDGGEVEAHDRIVALVEEVLDGAAIEPRHAEINEHVRRLYGTDLARTVTR